MPEYDWPEGHYLQLRTDPGGGTTSSWRNSIGSKFGKYYDLDDTEVKRHRVSSVFNYVGESNDTRYTVLGVAQKKWKSGGVLWGIGDTTKYGEQKPVILPVGYIDLQFNEYSLKNDELIGIIGSRHPLLKSGIPQLKVNLSQTSRTDDSIRVKLEDFLEAAKGNLNHRYDYATKNNPRGVINRDLSACPGDPYIYGFRPVWGDNNSAIICNYEWTEKDMKSLYKRAEDLGINDETDNYDQIQGILNDFCSVPANATIDLKDGNVKHQCWQYMNDVDLLKDYCKEQKITTKKYNAITDYKTCSAVNLGPTQYRETWKSICEDPDMYNSAECRLFWATESSLAARPKDNPDISDPCKRSNPPDVCGETQKIVDVIDEHLKDPNVNISGISNGSEKRLCYDGSGRTGTANDYDWAAVYGDDGICKTNIQVCNLSVVAEGAVESDFTQNMVCTQNDTDDDNGNPDIRNQRKTEADDDDDESDDKGDNKSDDKGDKKDDNDDDKSFLQKYWWILLIAAVLVMMMLLGIVVVV